MNANSHSRPAAPILTLMVIIVAVIITCLLGLLIGYALKDRLDIRITGMLLLVFGTWYAGVSWVKKENKQPQGIISALLTLICFACVVVQVLTYGWHLISGV